MKLHSQSTFALAPSAAKQEMSTPAPSNTTPGPSLQALVTEMYRCILDARLRQEQADRQRREPAQPQEPQEQANEDAAGEIANAEPQAPAAANLNANQQFQIVVTDDYHDIEVDQVIEQFFTPPPPSAIGEPPTVLVPRNKIAEIFKSLNTMSGEE